MVLCYTLCRKKFLLASKQVLLVCVCAPRSFSVGAFRPFSEYLHIRLHVGFLHFPRTCRSCLLSAWTGGLRVVPLIFFQKRMIWICKKWTLFISPLSLPILTSFSVSRRRQFTFSFNLALFFCFVHSPIASNATVIIFYKHLKIQSKLFSRMFSLLF